MFNAPRRHSLKDGPLIDWDLIMVMEPVTILGTILGGYLNKVDPSYTHLKTMASHEPAGCVRGVLAQQGLRYLWSAAF